MFKVGLKFHWIWLYKMLFIGTKSYISLKPKAKSRKIFSLLFHLSRGETSEIKDTNFTTLPFYEWVIGL